MIDKDNKKTDDYQEQLIKTAVLYYRYNMTQSEIAERLYISRSTVCRLLREAHNLHLVEIKINGRWNHNIVLEKDLHSEFPNLKHISVVENSTDDPNFAISDLTEYAANTIESRLKKNSVLGLDWNSLILQIIDNIRYSKNIPITIVPTLGGFEGISKSNTSVLHQIYNLSRLYNATYQPLTAPLFVSSYDLKTSLLSEPSIASALDLARNADVILTSIGTIDIKENYILRKLYKTIGISSLITDKGVGSIGGHFFDINGTPVLSEQENLIIGLTLQEYKNAKNVICVEGSPNKAPAILGALNGGYIHTLILNASTAQAILRHVS